MPKITSFVLQSNNGPFTWLSSPAMFIVYLYGIGAKQIVKMTKQ